jgi:hypothetical protein
MNISDMEFTDSETEREGRHPVCNISQISSANLVTQNKPKVQLPSFSPQRYYSYISFTLLCLSLSLSFTHSSEESSKANKLFLYQYSPHYE